MSCDLQVQRAQMRLSNHAPYSGTGLRRQQSDNGKWLPIALERGRQIAEILSHYRTNQEGYAAVWAAIGIKDRQARSYLKLWSLRFILQIIWEQRKPEELPRSIEEAIDAARGVGTILS